MNFAFEVCGYRNLEERTCFAGGDGAALRKMGKLRVQEVRIVLGSEHVDITPPQTIPNHFPNLSEIATLIKTL